MRCGQKDERRWTREEPRESTTRTRPVQISSWALSVLSCTPSIMASLILALPNSSRQLMMRLTPKGCRSHDFQAKWHTMGVKLHLGEHQGFSKGEGVKKTSQSGRMKR